MALFISNLISIALLFCATVTSASGVEVTTKHLSEASRTLNLSNVAYAVPPPVVERAAKKPYLDKRDGVDCLFPESSLGAADVEDCNDLCAFFLENPQAWVSIPSLKLVKYHLGNCQLGLANLNPCSGVNVQYDSIVSWCQSMLGQCIINGYDGYYDLTTSYRMAAALTGDDAAPPYSETPC
jgi:hypothetical protein